MTILETLRAQIPRRRRRLWRYVSPRRHGAGLLLLAMLVTMAYGYWHFTNDEAIRVRAERYLQKLTGAKVSIRGADFAMFGQIRLYDVKLFARGDRWRLPLFEAKEVRLRHDPLHLFFGGEVLATQITPIEPTVTRVYYQGSPDSSGGSVGGSGLWRLKRLPAIRSKGGLLRVYEQTGDEAPRQVASWPMSFSGAPDVADETRYVFRFDERPKDLPPSHGTMEVNLHTGERTLEGEVPDIHRVTGVLPPRQRELLDRHQVRGALLVRSETRDGETIYSVTLKDVSLKLLEAEGGLSLRGVNGQLIFDSRGVTVRNVTGRVPDAGNAVCRVQGRYDGYDADSPYALTVALKGLAVPEIKAVGGRLESIVEILRRDYRPEGKMDVEMTFSRDAKGNTTYKGIARPKGMRVFCRWFKYPFGDVRGAVAFSPGRVELRSLTARHGSGRVTGTGTILGKRGRVLDLTFKAETTPFDDDLHAALPDAYKRFWDLLQPAGSTGAVVRVTRSDPEATQRVEVTLIANGEASMAYRAFPYRIEGLFGRVHITPERVSIPLLRGGRGDMQCKIAGTLTAPGGPEQEADLTIRADRLPLDKTLLAALKRLHGPSHDALTALAPRGWADRVDLSLRQKAGEKLTYRIDAQLKDAAFAYEGFPYEVTDLSGPVTIVPGEVRFGRSAGRADAAKRPSDLQGRHGKTPVTIGGKAMLADETVALDLHVGAEGIPLDDDLRDALPPSLLRTWRRLRPGGRADAKLHLRHDPRDPDEPLDYTLELDARGMSLRCDDFPYPLRGITGQAIATPDRVVLNNIRAVEGKMIVTLNGQILLGDSEEADLSVTAKNVPIDKALLAAMPTELAPLLANVRPGGTCGVAFKTFRFSRPAAGPATRPAALPATRPAAPPTTRPTTRPAESPVNWKVAGTLDMNGAILDLRFGRKVLTGRIAGWVARDAEGLSMDTAVAFQKIAVGSRMITGIRGRLSKRARHRIIDLTDLTANAYKGRLEGVGYLKLTDPLQYALRMEVAGIDLDALYNAGAKKDAAKELPVTGVLEGNLRLHAILGPKPIREASGELLVSKGKVRRLPVLMGLLHVLYLTLPGDTAFSDGYLTYRLKNDAVVFDRIYMVGRGPSVIGSGTMNLKTKRLKFSFLTGPAAKPRPIGPLAELLEGIAWELAEVQVTGTIARPIMRTVPLRTLDKVIRKLLNPSQGAR